MISYTQQNLSQRIVYKSANSGSFEHFFVEIFEDFIWCVKWFTKGYITGDSCEWSFRRGGYGV